MNIHGTKWSVVLIQFTNMYTCTWLYYALFDSERCKTPLCSGLFNDKRWIYVRNIFGFWRGQQYENCKLLIKVLLNVILFTVFAWQLILSLLYFYYLYFSNLFSSFTKFIHYKSSTNQVKINLKWIDKIKWTEKETWLRVRTLREKMLVLQFFFDDVKIQSTKENFNNNNKSRFMKGNYRL